MTTPTRKISMYCGYLCDVRVSEYHNPTIEISMCEEGLSVHEHVRV
jgi:hypothetical protein